MRKSISKLSTIAAVLVIFVCQTAFANSVLIGVQVTMPSSTGITVKMTEVKSDGNVWGITEDITASGGTINFDNHPMVVTDEGVYLTGYYYVLDIAPAGGGWAGSGVTFSYSAGINDIGLHSKATLVECVYTAPDTKPDENDIATYGLHDMNRTIPITSYDEGWLRVYIGLSTGQKTGKESEEGLGITPFTAATPAGLYSGSLTISYTGS